MLTSCSSAAAAVKLFSSSESLRSCVCAAVYLRQGQFASNIPSRCHSQRLQRPTAFDAQKSPHQACNPSAALPLFPSTLSTHTLH